MNYFLISFISIVKLFSLALGGYLFFKIKIFHKYYKYLLYYVVDIGLPILIIVRMAKKINYHNFNQYIIIFFAGVTILLTGFLLGLIFAKIFKIEEKYKSIFLGLMTFTNMGYLPIPLFESIFKGEAAIQAQLYVFIIIIPFHLLLWSIGVPLILNRKFKLKELRFKITTPFVAVLIGLILPFLKIPQTFFNTIEPGFSILAKSLNPLIMIMLGGSFANMSLNNIKFDRYVFAVILAKLLFLPLIALIVIINLNFDTVLKIFLLVEFSVPPAVNIVIINKRYGGTEENLKFILSSMVYTYIFSIISLPLLLFILNLFS